MFYGPNILSDAGITQKDSLITSLAIALINVPAVAVIVGMLQIHVIFVKDLCSVGAPIVSEEPLLDGNVNSNYVLLLNWNDILYRSFGFVSHSGCAIFNFDDCISVR